MPDVLTYEGAKQTVRRIEYLEECVRDHNLGKSILPDKTLCHMLDEIYALKCRLGSPTWNPSGYLVETLQ